MRHAAAAAAGAEAADAVQQPDAEAHPGVQQPGAQPLAVQRLGAQVGAAVVVAAGAAGVAVATGG